MSFRLSTWNINEGRPADDVTERFDWVEQARRARPDVLLVQECGFTADDVDLGEASKQLGLAYWATLVYSQAAHTADGRAGLAILSRYPIAATRSRLFTNPVGNIAPDDVAVQHRFNKGTLSVLAETPVGAMWVMNLHCYPFRYYGLTAEADAASTVWTELAAEAASVPGPLVLGGDFNSRNRDLLLDRAPGLARVDPTSPPLIDDFVSRCVKVAGPVEVDQSTSSDHPIVSTTVIDVSENPTDLGAEPGPPD